MPWTQIAIAALQIYFTIMEQAGKSKEEVEAFYMKQRIKFRTENAPKNLPDPPDVAI